MLRTHLSVLARLWTELCGWNLNSGLAASLPVISLQFTTRFHSPCMDKVRRFPSMAEISMFKVAFLHLRKKKRISLVAPRIFIRFTFTSAYQKKWHLQ